jgi:hypothetical protein
MRRRARNLLVFVFARALHTGTGCAQGACKAKCVTSSVRAGVGLHVRRTERRLMCWTAVCALVCARKDGQIVKLAACSWTQIGAHLQKLTDTTCISERHIMTQTMALLVLLLMPFYSVGLVSYRRLGRLSHCFDTILEGWASVNDSWLTPPAFRSGTS